MAKQNIKLNIWIIFIGAIGLSIFIWFIVQNFIAPESSVSEGKMWTVLNSLSKPKEQIKDIKAYGVYGSEFASTVAIKYIPQLEDGSTISNYANITSYILNTESFRSDMTKLLGVKEGSSLEILKFVKKQPIDFLSVVMWILPSIILGFIILFVFTRFMKMGAMGLGEKGFQGTVLKKSEVLFSDVAGIQEEKKELIEIVNFLLNPGKYKKMGARIPKGLLLYGPPGTGKTLLAKAVSGESKVPFFSVAGSAFEEALVGLGASRIRNLFRNAKKNAPCIVFIDEIDSLASDRNARFGNGNDQTLNQFLSELDGFDENVGVVIIGATNRMEILDPALLRSGRFDRKIQVNLPDLKEREEILKIHARKKNIGKDVNFSDIAARTPGFSGAELENSLNEAALLAVRKNKNIIDLEEIDEGIDRVIGGPAKVSKIINEKTRILVAVHESGHSLIGLLLSEAMKVQKVTIIPRGNAGGYTITTPKDETSLYSKKTLTERLIGLLGGRAAEEIIFGKNNITTGAHDDFSKATIIAKQMVKKFGMSSAGIRYLDEGKGKWSGLNNKDLSEKVQEKIDHNIDQILNDSFEEAKALIKKETKLLFLIAESLLILETITSQDVDYIFKEKKLPEKAQMIKDNKPDKVFLNWDLFKEDDIAFNFIKKE